MLTLLIILFIVGIALHYFPVEQPIKNIIIGIVVILAAIAFLQLLGVWPGHIIAAR